MRNKVFIILENNISLSAMEQMITHIADLLVLHDCVIIPGFGGLICNYQSAEIDKRGFKITPPQKSVLFNYKLQHNDGLLANHVAMVEGISYGEAMLRINVFVEEVKTHLLNREKVELGNIGTFRMDSSLNIEFNSGAGNFLADTYGMSPLFISDSYQMSANIDSKKWMQRTMKYGIAAAMVVGIAMVIITNVVPTRKNVAFSSVNPSIKQSEYRLQTSEISPEYDYVDYDPAESLNN